MRRAWPRGSPSTGVATTRRAPCCSAQGARSGSASKSRAWRACCKAGRRDEVPRAARCSTQGAGQATCACRWRGCCLGCASCCWTGTPSALTWPGRVPSTAAWRTWRWFSTSSAPRTAPRRPAPCPPSTWRSACTAAAASRTSSWSSAGRAGPTARWRPAATAASGGASRRRGRRRLEWPTRARRLLPAWSRARSTARCSARRPTT
mmetsp:Transcript_12820/g.34075  ORF Transcript_12820/g.34075 Transcript_12820/m.34075 type:complete len:206 (+) Transcript_12820:151-768(+)